MLCFSNIVQILICWVYVFIQFKIVFSFSLTLLLVHGLFTGMLFCFQIVKDFLEIFVNDFWFNFIVVREHSLYDLNIFEFVETCFVAQNMVCLGKCFTYTCKKCVSLLGGVSYECPLGHVSWQCYSSLPYPCWFCLLMLSNIESGVLNPAGIIVDLFFFVILSVFALCILKLCYWVCNCFRDSSVLLMYEMTFSWEMTFFVPGNIFLSVI